MTSRDAKEPRCGGGVIFHRERKHNRSRCVTVDCNKEAIDNLVQTILIVKITVCVLYVLKYIPLTSVVLD